MTLLVLLLGVCFIGGVYFDRHRRALFIVCVLVTLGLFSFGTIG